MNDESIKMGFADIKEFAAKIIGLLSVLLFDVVVDGIHVTKDEVEFLFGAASIRSEHDGVRRFVVKFSKVRLGVGGEELDVGAAAAHFRLELDLVLEDEGFSVGGLEWFC